MMRNWRQLTTALSLMAWIAGTASAAEPRWKQHTINAKSEFEAAGVFDVDGDGKLDVVSGDTWYQAPSWSPSKVRELAKIGSYYNDFANLPFDVNQDGKIDFITCGYFSKNVGWVENPGVKGKEWTYHEIALPGTSETATLVDLTGMANLKFCRTPPMSSSGMRRARVPSMAGLQRGFGRYTTLERKPPGTVSVQGTSTVMVVWTC